jgi:hypothetical protein
MECNQPARNGNTHDRKFTKILLGVGFDFRNLSEIADDNHANCMYVCLTALFEMAALPTDNSRTEKTLFLQHTLASCLNILDIIYNRPHFGSHFIYFRTKRAMAALSGLDGQSFVSRHIHVYYIRHRV